MEIKTTDIKCSSVHKNRWHNNSLWDSWCPVFSSLAFNFQRRLKDL